LTPRIVSLAGIFNSADLLTEVSHNVMGLIWDKLLVNVGINALTAITGLKNGGLLASRHTEELLELAVTEAQKVGLAKGIKFNFADPVAHTKEVCLATAENTSSMLQDIKNQRRTEIDQINGAIVREGKLSRIETPVNQVLYNLVKMKEADYE
jgi:2-dehydropantoate 2-reductase